MAGGLLVFAPPDLPPEWNAPDVLLRAVGFALLTLAAFYFGLCFHKGGQRIRWRDRTLTIPSLGIAGVQIVLSVVSWSAVGAVITWLLPEGVSWFAVMPVLLTSAVAGVISHVPGGIGVLEAVFVAMLGHEVGKPRLVGALLAFRACYYLVPFAISAAVFGVLEATAGDLAQGTKKA
jgi:uncharacterized membrane protein YbhN (UPF0104 family)